MIERKKKGKAIFEKGDVHKIGNIYLVESQTSPDYYVIGSGEFQTSPNYYVVDSGGCDCPDHKYKDVTCKHMWAVHYHQVYEFYKKSKKPEMPTYEENTWIERRVCEGYCKGNFDEFSVVIKKVDKSHTKMLIPFGSSKKHAVEEMNNNHEKDSCGVTVFNWYTIINVVYKDGAYCTRFEWLGDVPKMHKQLLDNVCGGE